MVYCGKDCLKAHWPEHKILCNAIKHEIEQKTPKTNYTSSGIFVSHLTPKQHAKVISLVGRRCAIKARLNEKVVQILEALFASLPPLTALQSCVLEKKTRAYDYP
jgi:hypothetical protein